MSYADARGALYAGLIFSDQGSAPRTAVRRRVSRSKLTPIFSATSERCSMYEGVHAIAVTLRSWMSSICRSVLPTEAGTTVAPILSAP